MIIKYQEEITQPKIAFCQCGKYCDLKWNFILKQYLPYLSNFVEDEGHGWHCPHAEVLSPDLHMPLPVQVVSLPLEKEKIILAYAFQIKEARGFSDDACVSQAMDVLYYQFTEAGSAFCPLCERNKKAEDKYCAVCEARRFNLPHFDKQPLRYNFLNTPYPVKPWRKRL